MVVVGGGHVGAVVGSRARQNLYPVITDWFKTRIGAQPVVLRDVTKEAGVDADAIKTPVTGIEALAAVKYVGDWIAVQAHKELGINTIDELIDAAKANKLQTLNGIGPAKEKAILEAAQSHINGRA